MQRGGLPEDAIVLSGAEVANLQDRLFQLRCATEDVLTALDDGASSVELRTLLEHVADAATQAERLRS